jgi:carboxymethylenebutenolidase
MREAVRQAGKAAAELQVYPEAGHGFHADYRPSYDEAAAKDGWTRCLGWFRQHGVG